MPSQESPNASLTRGEGDPISPEMLIKSTGYLISTIGRLLRERFEQTIRPTGLRARHIGVLASLKAHGPLAQGAVAQQQAMDKSTMVAVVDDLEAAGFVERRRNPFDRRIYDLTLTEAGAHKLAAAAAAVAEVQPQWFAALNEEEQGHLHALLTRLLYGPNGLLPEPEHDAG